MKNETTNTTKVNGCFYCAFGQWVRGKQCDAQCDNHGPDKFPGYYGPNAYVLCPNCGATNTQWARTPDEAYCPECGRSHRFDAQLQQEESAKLDGRSFHLPLVL